MATYTDQLVVYSAGSVKKIGDTETVEIHGIELTSSLTVPEGGFTLGSTAITSTAAELNILDGVTSTAAELNILDGVTASTTEINYLDITTLGTAEASKVITVDGSSQVDASAITFTDLGTITTADINGGTIDGVTIGGSSAGAGTFTTLDCNDGAFAIANLDIDGGTDIGAALVDADLFIVDDGAGGTNRKSAVSRIKTYIETSTLTFTGANTFTNSSGQTIQGAASGEGIIYLEANANGSAGDSWKITSGGSPSATLKFSNDIASAGSYTDFLTLTPSATAVNSNATFAGDVTITGDLTVQGDTTTLTTTNTVVSDKLFELGNGTSGTPSGDAGIIIERGTSDNAIIAWDESDDIFVLGTTTATGASSGDLTITAAGLSISALTLGGAAITSTAAELNILDGVTATAAELNILDGATLDVNELNILDGVTATTAELNILDGVTATASEINLLDGDTAVGSSITIADADGILINDAGTMKSIPASDLKNYINASAAGSIAANDIIAGDAAVEITTSTGDVVVDAPTGQSVDLQVNGSNVIEVAGGRVDVSQPLIISTAGVSLTPASTHPAISAGNILAFEAGAGGGLELADCYDSTPGVANYLNTPFGVALESSDANATDAIMVHTIHGGIVNVTLSSSTTTQGQWVYLSDTAGTATTTAPSNGMVWRLGLSTEHNGSAVTDVDIIWMPQFIADLG